MKLLQALRREHFDTRARPASIPQCAISAAALPLEIQFLIIDEFEGQTVQLREICRVCIAWAEHAQALLFRSICLRDGDRERFLAVLNTSRNIGRHVTALKVVEYHTWWIGLLEGLNHALVEQLPSLRTLDVSWKHFSRLSKYVTGVPPHSTTISRLCLQSCTFGTSDTLVAFVAAFPRLESLYIARCSWIDDAATTPRSLIARSAWHLKYLALDGTPQILFFKWMVAEPAALTVDHLRIISLGPDASMFNALLHRISAWLSHLEIPNTHHLAENTDIPLSIRACTALTALTFRAHIRSDPRQGTVFALEQVAFAAPLAAVFIHIPLDGCYREVQWELVDASLDTDAFPRLERVEFRIFRSTLTDAHWVSARLHLASRMVLLHARGLLQFVDGDRDEGPTAAHILAPLPEPPRPARRSRLGGLLGRA